MPVLTDWKLNGNGINQRFLTECFSATRILYGAFLILHFYLNYYGPLWVINIAYIVFQLLPRPDGPREKGEGKREKSNLVCQSLGDWEYMLSLTIWRQDWGFCCSKSSGMNYLWRHAGWLLVTSFFAKKWCYYNNHWGLKFEQSIIFACCLFKSFESLYVS